MNSEFEAQKKIWSTVNFVFQSKLRFLREKKQLKESRDWNESVLKEWKRKSLKILFRHFYGMNRSTNCFSYLSFETKMKDFYLVPASRTIPSKKFSFPRNVCFIWLNLLWKRKSRSLKTKIDVRDERFRVKCEKFPHTDNLEWVDDRSQLLLDLGRWRK